MLTTVAHDCLQVQQRQRRLLLGLLLVALPTLGQVPTGTATFVKTDSSTAGAWKGVYGADGFNVIGDSASVPGYVTVTPSGNSPWVWASSTSDTRAVQKASNPADRIAACWYSSGQFTIDLAFNDSNTHPVAVYLVDWDNFNVRAEEVDVIDANNNLLDTRSVSSFTGGQYLVWNLSGHVILRITNTNPSSNAVVSGLFFGAGGSVPPPLPPTGAATFVRTDISTAGTWQGVYGADGFNVIGNSASVPAYVTVTPSENSSWVWASSTSDTRALQKASSPADRMAACWYSSTSFSIDLAFNDSNTHPVAVYLVDWDNYNGRAERVDVIDANNNLLDTRSVASFTGGQYLVWNLSGHVILRVTNTNPSSNAVVSGLFFGTLPPTVSVSMSPSSVNLLAGGSQQFSAAVLGSANTNVTWSLSPVIGSITAAGLYTAPATLSSQQIVTVKATSLADATKSATAAVTLTPPVSVTVSPASVTLTQSQTQTFSATVTGTSNTVVTWSLSPVVGSITAAGLYTAPASITGSQSVTVKATSVADSTKSATAIVTLNLPVNVTVSPASVTLTQSQTHSFAAAVTNTSNTAVTWSISPLVGSITAAGLYTAPVSISSAQNVTVKATSVADPTKSASATVSLNPPVGVTVSPASVTLTQSQTQSFAAAVTNTSNTAVTWSISPVAGSITAAGVYTAPASTASTQSVTVTASSVADPTRSAAASVTLNPPVGVTVSPANVTLTQSQTQSFSATVTNIGNTAVTWSLSPVAGSITAAGVYTAPASIASSQTVTVKATSVADSTRSASATVTLNPPVSVTVSPASVTLTQSQTQSFSATVTNIGNTAVTWSLSPVVGSVTAAGLYTPPASITSSQTVTVKATSVADPTKSAVATIALNPSVTISLTSPSVSLQPSQNQTFTATVAGTSNTGVTWSLNPALGSLASSATTAVYVAPSAAPTTQSVTITAGSMADPSKTATALITLLQAVTVSLSPPTVSLAPSGTQQFTATVLGTSNTAVTWSITPPIGTISSAGLYAAPSSILTSQTVTVTAQSVAELTKSASATINLSPPTGTFTHYVDSAIGSDSNPGTQAAPWKTIAKVNSTRLTPGQSVGFASGGVWREALTPGQSGTAGNPITFAAYGSGAQPIITGSNLISGWSTTSTANVWQSTVTFSPNRTAVLIRNGAPGILVSSLAAVVANYDWYANGTTVYLYDSATNPNTDTIEISARDYVVEMYLGPAYITLANLHLRGANNIDLFLYAANNISILNCEIDNSSSVGVYVGNGSYNLIFNGGSIHNTGINPTYDGDGIGIGEDGTASHDILIEGMDIYANGIPPSVGSAIGIGSTNNTPYNVTITNNQLSAASYAGLNVSAGTSIVATYNVITANGYCGVAATSGIGDVSLVAYNNTIAGNAQYGLVEWADGGTVSVTQKNNIFYNNASEIWWSSGAAQAITSKYNEIYHSLPGPIISYGGATPSFATWQSTYGQDGQSITGNPLFVNAGSGNYAPQAGSPAIGAGVYIPGVSTANPPNIGAK